MGDRPELPRMKIEDMLSLATENFAFFCDIAYKAGHTNAELFLSILQTAAERKKATTVKTYSAYSIERFRFEPDPQFEQYYQLLEGKADRLAAKATKVFAKERRRVLARMQDSYKQVYERELHTLVYLRVSSGMSLMKAYAAVQRIFEKRVEELMEFGNMPLYVKEAQAEAMKGSYAKTVIETPVVYGPTEVFGELGIQSKRLDMFSFGGPGSGLGGGRRYWPRGNPDGSCDE